MSLRYYPGPSLVPCPYCNCPMDCDSVDIGIGYTQCGPYCCDNCGASEMGPERVHKNYPRPFTREQQIWWDGTSEEERMTGMYYGGRHSPHANTINGKLVSHEVAKAAYELGLLDPKPSQFYANS